MDRQQHEKHVQCLEHQASWKDQVMVLWYKFNLRYGLCSRERINMFHRVKELNEKEKGIANMFLQEVQLI